MLIFTNESGNKGYVLFYGHRNPSVHSSGTKKNVGQGVLTLRNPNARGRFVTKDINLGDQQLMYELRQNAKHHEIVYTNQHNLKIKYKPEAQIIIQGYSNVTQIALYYLENPPAYDTIELQDARFLGPN